MSVRIAVLLMMLGLGTEAFAQTTGSATKLPVPRFVSLKPSDTPLREGPGKDHAIRWVFKREGLPVEIIAEHDQWRRIRDSESAEGWVFHGRLSARRTLVVLPGKDGALQPLFGDDTEKSREIARLEPGVIAQIEECSKEWCRISVGSYTGFLRKAFVWGVYPDEIIE
jgi:SH3-like domain-containing protein